MASQVQVTKVDPQDALIASQIVRNLSESLSHLGTGSSERRVVLGAIEDGAKAVASYFHPVAFTQPKCKCRS